MDSKEEIEKEEKAWREVKSSKKFLNASRGIHVFLATTVSAYKFVYVLSIGIVVALGCYFQVSSLEWIALVFCIGFVLVTEILNTAIEIDIDLTSPGYHTYARDTKDVAGAAVLLSLITAIIVALIIFLPKFLNMI